VKLAARHPRPADMTPIRAAWRTEIDHARTARADRDEDFEWHHLERAHILSQPSPGIHTRTHLHMLAHALRRRDRRETLGQILRLVLAGPGSFTGRYPLGNTGGANVSAFAPMPVPPDFTHLLLRPTA
jgi:hypothetical protein